MFAGRQEPVLTRRSAGSLTLPVNFLLAKKIINMTYSLPNRFLIYGLLNPIINELFYIGQTRKRREFRLLEHIESSVSGRELPVYDYIRRVLFKGTIPQIFVIDKMEKVNSQDEVNQREKYWIQWFNHSQNFELPLDWTPKTPKSNNVIIKSVKLMNQQWLTSSCT